MKVGKPQDELVQHHAEKHGVDDPPAIRLRCVGRDTHPRRNGPRLRPMCWDSWALAASSMAVVSVRGVEGSSIGVDRSCISASKSREKLQVPQSQPLRRASEGIRDRFISSWQLVRKPIRTRNASLNRISDLVPRPRVRRAVVPDSQVKTHATTAVVTRSRANRQQTCAVFPHPDARADHDKHCMRLTISALSVRRMVHCRYPTDHLVVLLKVARIVPVVVKVLRLEVPGKRHVHQVWVGNLPVDVEAVLEAASLETRLVAEVDRAGDLARCGQQCRACRLTVKDLRAHDAKRRVDRLLVKRGVHGGEEADAWGLGAACQRGTSPLGSLESSSDQRRVTPFVRHIVHRAEGQDDDLAGFEIAREEGRAVFVERSRGEGRAGNVHEVLGSSRVVVRCDHAAWLWGLAPTRRCSTHPEEPDEPRQAVADDAREDGVVGEDHAAVLAASAKARRLWRSAWRLVKALDSLRKSNTNPS